MAKPIFIYEMKDDFVETQIIGTPIPHTNLLGTMIKNISYGDFYELMKSTADTSSTIRSTTSTELEAVYKAMELAQSNNRNTVIYPKKTVEFKKTGDRYSIVQLLQGSRNFPNFSIKTDTATIRFDTNKFLFNTILQPNQNHFIVEDIKVYLLNDLIYKPNTNLNTTEISTLSKYLMSKLQGRNIPSISKLNPMGILKTFKLNTIPQNEDYTELIRQLQGIIDGQRDSIDWREV